MKVVNICASLNTCSKLNLRDIAEKWPQEMIKYIPGKFPGLSLRLGDPRVTLLVFTSRKLVCMGAKIDEDVQKAFELFLNIFKIENKNFEVQFHNFVGSGSMDRP